MADMDQRAGRIPEAGVHLRESLEITTRMGDPLGLLNCLDSCGHLCAATQRWAEAVTVWAAQRRPDQRPMASPMCRRTRNAARHLCGRPGRRWGPRGTRAAEQRGAAMTASHRRRVRRHAHRAPSRRSRRQRRSSAARERELVTLVAQGRTNAQIAGQLYISVRTVSSHLDRIRDKTGCRRRADLTRLALQAGLV